jgi:hypothetical protein
MLVNLIEQLVFRGEMDHGMELRDMTIVPSKAGSNSYKIINPRTRTSTKKWFLDSL